MSSAGITNREILECGACRSIFLFQHARLTSKSRHRHDGQGARCGAAHCLAPLHRASPPAREICTAVKDCIAHCMNLIFSSWWVHYIFFLKIIYIILIYATYAQYNFCYIHIYGHRCGKIPASVGYEDAMRRQLTRGGEEGGRKEYSSLKYQSVLMVRRHWVPHLTEFVYHL